MFIHCTKAFLSLDIHSILMLCSRRGHRKTILSSWKWSSLTFWGNPAPHVTWSLCVDDCKLCACIVVWWNNTALNSQRIQCVCISFSKLRRHDKHIPTLYLQFWCPHKAISIAEYLYVLQPSLLPALPVASENNTEERIVLNSCSAVCSSSFSVLLQQRTNRLMVTFEEQTSIISWAHRNEGVGRGTGLGSMHASSIPGCFVSCTPQVAPVPEETSTKSSVLKCRQHLSPLRV